MGTARPKADLIEYQVDLIQTAHMWANQDGNLWSDACVYTCVLVRAGAQARVRAHAHGIDVMCVHRMLCSCPASVH